MSTREAVKARLGKRLSCGIAKFVAAGFGVESPATLNEYCAMPVVLFAIMPAEPAVPAPVTSLSRNHVKLFALGN